MSNRQKQQLLFLVLTLVSVCAGSSWQVFGPVRRAQQRPAPDRLTEGGRWPTVDGKRARPQQGTSPGEPVWVPPKPALFCGGSSFNFSGHVCGCCVAPSSVGLAGASNCAGRCTPHTAHNTAQVGQQTERQHIYNTKKTREPQKYPMRKNCQLMRSTTRTGGGEFVPSPSTPPQSPSH